MTTTTTTTRLIATLESYLSPTIPVSPPAPSTSSTTTTTTTSSPALHLIPTSTLTKLRHLGTARARDMRALGHTTQIVSHVPVPAALPACAKANDALHAGMALFGERFAGLALLPGEGADAARELQRCVTKYRFVGGVLGLCGWGARGEAGTVALDGARFEGVWEAAQRLRVPVILRGAWADTAEVAEYTAGLLDTVVAPLAALMHTAHVVSPVPVLRLFLAGVFDRYPNLRLVIANPGVLPCLMPRIAAVLAAVPADEKPKRSFLDVWQHNVYLTTADALDMASMRALLEQIPIDRVLYASNYPLEERGDELMAELRESGFLSQQEWDKVAWANAEYLFGLGKPSTSGGAHQSVYR